MLTKRPLTTLLLAATICADIAVWTAERDSGPNLVAILSMSLSHSQVGLLSVWLAMGQLSWWLRFSAWTIAIFAICVFTSPVGAFAANFPATCAILFGYAVVVWLLAMGAAVAFRIDARSATAGTVQRPPRQFSIAHLLSWTTFAAILAMVVRGSEFRGYFSLDNVIRIVIQYGILAAIPVAALVLLWRRRQKWFRFAGLLVGAGVVALIMIAEHGGLSIYESFFVLAYLLIQAAVAGIWVIVVDYDTQWRTSK